ncbi:MAG TPA: VWA domain-containing protein [bacterium]|nr:VWA domain-containing protein [bacterium]HNB57163.1 VWA domain-containing protein [bacterium]HNC48341.1 VWA domain-containing protein [bacterium]HNO10908.1 VWA domain-containing protein [bacterium]
MRFEYSQFMPGPSNHKMKFDDLMKIFNQLLLLTDGDVSKALSYMTQIDRQYHIFNEDMDFQKFYDRLVQEGYIEESQDGSAPVLSPKGERKIRQDSLDEIFSSLKKSPGGMHETNHTGEGVERLSETKPYQYGDPPSNIDFMATMNNAMKRKRGEDIELREDDFEVYETEHKSTCATVLAIDISHSMILYGEDRITPAKKVALALTELILTRYPKDSLDVITFGDEAAQIDLEDIPYIHVGPYHTNTKEALQLARQILRKRRNQNKQVFMITDGKPSCIREEGKLYKNSFGLDRKIVNQTLNEAAQCKKDNIVISTFMIADDPYLTRFVDTLTKTNKGRAFYAGLNELGQYIFVDYIKNRKKNVR